MPKFIAILAFLLVLSAILSCTGDVPPIPVRNNPLDANNPDTQGDPYHLRGEIADGGAQLTWDLFDWGPMTGFSLHRMEDNGAFSLLTQINATKTTYTDLSIQNGHRYDYYIVASSDAGDFQPSEYVTVTINSDPVLFIEGESVTHTPTRNVTLTILAFGAEQMLLSNTSDTARASWEAATSTRQWQLETGVGTKSVYLWVKYTGDEKSDLVVDQIEPSPLNPSVFINNVSTHTPTRSVHLSLSATGATEMQISNDSLQGNESWQAYTEEYDWELATGSGTKTVYLNVRNDFLIESETLDQIEPSVLNPVLNILPDSTHINHTDITLSMPNVGASEMKIANSSDSSSINWQPYEDTLNWNILSDDGWKRVYVWFKNDFYPTTEPVVDSVGLDTNTEIASFDWSGTGGDTLVFGDNLSLTLHVANDAFGAETNGRTEVSVEGWEPITLFELGNGWYAQTFTLTEDYPNVFNARVSALFEDRSGNRSVRVQANETLDAKTTRPEAGEEREFDLTDDVTITMVFIPVGEFEMGSPDDEDDRVDDEGPVHGVSFESSFWLGKYEVTQGQWEAVMNDNPSWYNGVNRPVENVSWDEVQEFESALDGAFRLPSESEWEYACRAGTTTRFYWGADGIDRYAVYISNHPYVNGNTAEVGTKLPNAWGLYDMSGNVLEWCEDWYHNSYNNAPDDGSAWISPSVGGRVIRGGSWGSVAGYCRSAKRRDFAQSAPYNYIGFRLARDAE